MKMSANVRFTVYLALAIRKRECEANLEQSETEAGGITNDYWTERLADTVEALEYMNSVLNPNSAPVNGPALNSAPVAIDPESDYDRVTDAKLEAWLNG